MTNRCMSTGKNDMNSPTSATITVTHVLHMIVRTGSSQIRIVLLKMLYLPKPSHISVTTRSVALELIGTRRTLMDTLDILSTSAAVPI